MTAIHGTSLTADLKAEAKRLGFELSGVAPAVTPPGYPSFLEWLNRGYAGEMNYMQRRKDAYEHPSGVLPDVKSVLMLGMNYKTTEPSHRPTNSSPSPSGEGPGVRGQSVGTILQPAQINSQFSILSSQFSAKVATYAQGSVDYHDLIRDRLKQLAAFLHDRVPGCRTRGVVDTAPLLERDFARLAGLGWFGKNTLLINKRAGSFLFLAGLLTDVVLNYDAVHETAHCGTCTRCLDACPTGAFPEPGVLDATKCISYLTIELKSPIPEALRSGVGNWLFGCDICQDVCPWNRKSPATSEPAFQPKAELNPADAASLLALSPSEFKQRFKGTPLSRPGRAGLLRNAAIVLGNTGDQSAVPALIRALHDDEPLIRGAAAWALGRLGGTNELRSRLSLESAPDVRTEILRALGDLGG